MTKVIRTVNRLASNYNDDDDAADVLMRTMKTRTSMKMKNSTMKRRVILRSPHFDGVKA